MTKESKSFSGDHLRAGLSVFSILIILVAGFGVSYPGAMAIFGLGVHADLLTVFLGVVLACEVGLGLWLAWRLGAIEIMAMLVFLLCQYFFPRILGYIALSRESLGNLYVLFPIKWNSVLIDQGLIWVVWSTGAMILAILLAIAGYRRWVSGSQRTRIALSFDSRLPTLPALVLATLVIYGVDTYFTLYLGQSASKNCIDESIRGKWLIHFFSGDMVIFYTLAVFSTKLNELSKRQWLYVIFSILVYLTYTLALGSRGGVLRVGTIVFALWLAAAPSARIRLKTLFTAVPVLAVASAVFFFLGTMTRQLGNAACSGGQTDVAAAAISVMDSDDLPSQFRDPIGSPLQLRDQRMLHLPASLAKISDRLGIIDYAIGTVAVPGDGEAKARYINPTYMIKNLINNLVLGVPFEDAKYMTSSMMPIIYRGYSYKHVEENFLSDMWTLWGSSYVMFGPYVGILFIFVVCFLFQFLFLLGSDRLGQLALFFRAGALWIGCAGVVFFHMSFDHAAFLFVIFHLQTIVTLGLFFGFDWLIHTIKSRRGVAI